jgi:ubiquinone/menaquinone biosynthesis C-methylase UbiE
MQKDIFLSGEGDAWYRRNKAYFLSLNENNDSVFDFIVEQKLSPKSVLEIGCADGRRLNIINKAFNAKCYGLDVSSEAIKEGTEEYSNIELNVGSADQLKFADKTFDLVIFGFCLYLCDRHDLFKIAAEADRVLKNNGMIIIKDFHPPYPYKNKYSHCDDIYSYKMDYSRLFTWNPAYTIFAQNVLAHDENSDRKLINERISLSLLYKDLTHAYIDNPDS